MKIKRTERGWAGHFCCADECLFRRNTLLEYGDIHIVVSTIGAMMDEDEFVEIGRGRYYETMAFHAKHIEDKYWDADVKRQVYFNSNWNLPKIDDDNIVNDMHEIVVNEIIDGLENGNDYSPT